MFILISISIQMWFYPKFGVSFGPAVKIQDQYIPNLEARDGGVQPKYEKNPLWSLILR